MVFETNTTYDYSFYYKQDSNIKPLPKTHNDVYYPRMQERANPNLIPTSTPTLNTNPVSNINMSTINRDKNSEAYYEFVYSPLLPKTTSNSTYSQEESVLCYMKRCFCCGRI